MTWEELNKKYYYDFNRLILCMPNDVKKDITEAWGGGALNPYNAADLVLEERKLRGLEVDLDVVAKKYEEKFLRKPHDSKRRRRVQMKKCICCMRHTRKTIRRLSVRMIRWRQCA